MKRPRKRGNEISYWESMADGVVALLLCILLILMLLILYLMRSTDEEYLGENDNPGAENGGYGYTYEHSYEYEEEGKGEGVDEEGDEEDDDGGGGGYPYEDPDPGMGEGDGSDKAAVLVQVVDGETQRTIKKNGIKFELYNSASALQVLSTYYPVKTDYKLYETDKEGMFYLPEKIVLGTYYLHQLTLIDGYDPAENWEFAPDRDYDWDEPYLVSVELFPSKNVIRLQVKDRETGDAVTGASFDIVASENISTQDGTIRFKQGEIADTISVDENGYAESKELYLGKYAIRQSGVPEYYSAIMNDTSVEVQSKSVSAQPPLNELKEQKTAIEIQAVDALYENQPINGAVFEVTTASGEKLATVKTGDDGKTVVTNLKKGYTYNIKQTNTASKYMIDSDKYSFTVSDNGSINGNEVENLQVKNRIVRASISVKDKFFRSNLSDVNVTLMDDSGKVIQSWNTTAVENMIEGLTPGEYKVVLAGDEKNEYSIVVKDVVEIQNFDFEKWTMVDIGCIIAGIAAAVIVIALVTFVIRRRKNKTNTEG